MNWTNSNPFLDQVPRIGEVAHLSKGITKRPRRYLAGGVRALKGFGGLHPLPRYRFGWYLRISLFRTGTTTTPPAEVMAKRLTTIQESSVIPPGGIGQRELPTRIELDSVPDWVPGLIRHRKRRTGEAIVVPGQRQNGPQGPRDHIPEGDLPYPGELVRIDDVDGPIPRADKGQMRIGPVFTIRGSPGFAGWHGGVQGGTGSSGRTGQLHPTVQLELGIEEVGACSSGHAQGSVVVEAHPVDDVGGIDDFVPHTKCGGEVGRVPSDWPGTS